MKMSAICAVIAIIAVAYALLIKKDNDMLKLKLDTAITCVSDTANKQETFDAIHKEMDAVGEQLSSVSESSFRAYLDKPLPVDAIGMLKQHSPNKL